MNTDPFNLQSLPELTPPDDDWPVIKAALEERAKPQPVWLKWSGALAAAALVVLTIGLIPETQVAPTRVTPTEASPALGSLITLSQDLENRLRSARDGSGATDAQTLVYQIELEDLITQVDEELSRNPQSIELWSQRVNLLLDIHRLYHHQLRRNYHNMASL